MKKDDSPNLHRKVLKSFIVLGSFLVYLIADGVSYSFGIFAREFIDHFEKYDNEGSVFIINGLLHSMPLFLSPIVCFLIEKFKFRPIVLIGSVLICLSFILTRFFVVNLTSLYLIIGLMTSCGLAMIYIPAYLIISFHFDKKRALATGLAVSGSGFGVFILPPLAEYLIDEYGWMNTCFLLGAISSHTFISYFLFQEPHISSSNNEETHTNSENRNEIRQLSTKSENLSKNSTEDTKFHRLHSILKDLKHIYSTKNFLIVNLSYFILSFAIAAPYNFLPSHIKLTKLEDPSSRSISLIGISSLIGQIAIGILSDYYRSINWLIYAICVIIAGLATCILPFLTEIHLIYIYSVVFGLATSVNYVLQSTLVIESLGLANLTLAFGCVQLIQGFSTLFGAPILGWIKDYTADYIASFITSGLIILLSGFVLLLWPLKQGAKNRNSKKNSNVLEFETLNVVNNA